MKLPFANRFGRGAKRVNRSFVRFRCEVDTELMLLDRVMSYEGRIIDISRGGALFRPKLAYIMRRANVPVCIQWGSEELFGQIVGTSPAGFSIRFEQPIDEELFDELTAPLRVTPKAAA
ncbi:PilZ domain-containing protein [Sphingosinicella sp. BN140058]|uniref:PilZ domain-containing protein n=1 Tax=Sphingosinicella sp. BN140058 TaxID=1892855 RepID=UPI001010A6E3|nr:PilZ domain-containing protein [Sphingosinicella sp. BN140058]QAY76352.1 PilZ domain-containing protein [Sphingosinicella sp. BN140058]